MFDDKSNFTVEIINIYRECRALWDFRHPDYKKRSVREFQYELLLKKYRERYPNAVKEDIIKKISVWRISYAREVKRRCSKDDKKQRRVARLGGIYFKALGFLKGIIPATNEISENASRNDSCEKALNDLVKISAKRLKIPKNPSQVLASVWADKLSQVNEKQRLMAEKLIDEIILNGQLGYLNFNSSLSEITTIN
ncbi:uncharacterized protein ACRADG_008507 [Cochliomyia hominivorax]